MEFYIIVTIYYFIINAVAFLCYYKDKKKAINGSRRISEKNLILLAFIGGAVGALLSMIIFHHKTKKRRFKIWVPFWLIFHILLIIFVTFQNNNLTVSYYSYDIDGVECRIAQVSDLHNAYMWFNKDYVANKVKAHSPDIIVITGDIVDDARLNIDKAVYQASKLCEIADTYYVTGNHEYYISDEHRDELISKLKNAGVHVLDNEYVLIDSFEKPFVLIGLDDNHLDTGRLNMIIDKMDDSSREYKKIVLAHEPQHIVAYSEAGADLVLAGHAHGGQMVIPFFGPVFAPGQGLRPKYTRGVYYEGNTCMIVSAGIGNSIFPIRLFDYPEIVIVDL